MKKYWPIITVLSVALLLRLVHGILPDIISWDGAVYVGMGKYLFSGGVVGVWEVLRPVGWPIMLGSLWSIGIDPYIGGMVIVVIASLWLIWLVYIIGERIRQYVGLIAATILASAPLFFQYSTIPMTDITSTCFVVLALYIYIAKKNPWGIFLSGLSIGIASMFRFPQGLMLLGVGALILADTFLYEQNTVTKKIHLLLKRGLVLGAGFAVVVVPFLIANYIAYGNALLPFIEGNNIIKSYPALYHKGPRFYFIELYKQHVLVVFALVPFLVLKRERFNRVLVQVCITLFIYFAYFLYQPHKEARYILSFLPFVSMAAGYGLVILLDLVRIRPKLLVILILLLGIYTNISQLSSQTGDSAAVMRFSSYFKNTPYARILSSAPFPALSDALIVQTLYNDWNDAYQKYRALRDGVDYVSIDSCVLEVGCADDILCYKNKTELLATLEKKEENVFSETANRCDMRIYKIRH
jgi:hypothetical protein